VTPKQFCWDIAEQGRQVTNMLCKCEEAQLW